MTNLVFSSLGEISYFDLNVSWALAIAKTLDDTLEIIRPENMDSFKLESDVASNKLIAKWTGNKFLGETFEVTICWEKDQDSKLYFANLSWANNTSNFYIEEVRFPFITSKQDEDSKFLKPDNCGELASMRYVAQRGKRWFYCSMQWTALFPANKNYGYYFDCRDSEHYIKQYDYHYENGIFSHYSIFYVPLLEENKANFAMPIVVLSVNSTAIGMKQVSCTNHGQLSNLGIKIAYQLKKNSIIHQCGYGIEELVAKLFHLFKNSVVILIFQLL